MGALGRETNIGSVTACGLAERRRREGALDGSEGGTEGRAGVLCEAIRELRSLGLVELFGSRGAAVALPTRRGSPGSGSGS